MRRAAALLTVCFAFCANPTRAQQTCPWLTEGTAAAVLGGAPQLQVKLVTPAEGSCSFELAQGLLMSTLQIVVSSRMLAACPPGSPRLTGIGNEASGCQLHATPGEVQYIVDSRVRSLHFRASLTVQDRGESRRGAGGRQNAQAAARIIPEQEENVQHIAEQVAGSLF